MFLLRSAFWLTIVIMLIPADPQTGEAPRITVVNALMAAQATVADLGGFCGRNPDVCVTGSAAIDVFAEKAGDGVDLIYHYFGRGGGCGGQPGNPHHRRSGTAVAGRYPRQFRIDIHSLHRRSFAGASLPRLYGGMDAKPEQALSVDQIVADFELLDDWEDRYRYVIELGRGLTPLPDAEHSDGNKVRGCASQVWLATRETTTNGQPFASSSRATAMRSS